jgi:hypothetical protein
MPRTTRTSTHHPAGPLADAGPYDYDLPATRAAGPPPVAPRPVWKKVGLSVAETAWLFVILFGTPYISNLTGWRLFECYIILFGVYPALKYRPQPGENFARWVLKAVGMWLNCYVGFVTVPESLRGLLPESLAFGLPAFIVTAALYYVAPVKPDTGKKWPFRQWLLVAAWAATVWAWMGPNFIK